MKKYEIVKKNTDFNDIINKGKYFKNRLYIIYFKVGEENRFPRFGLAVSKKCGNAVVRNKLKRQLRMIIDNNKDLFDKRNDYIIMARKSIVNVSFQEMEDNFIELFRKDEKIEKV